MSTTSATRRRYWAPTSIFVLLALPIAQAPGSELKGQISGTFGELVANAPVRLVHQESGDSWRSVSDEQGQFSFSEISPGSVYLQVRVYGFEYAPYQSDGIQLPAQGVVEVNVELSQGMQLNTIGDDIGIATARILADREVPNRPIPRDSDGHPDLTGMWVYASDPFQPEPRLREEAAELVRERNANFFVDSPRFRCLPTSLPVPNHTPPILGKIIQTPELTVILYEGILGYRQIFTDDREHPDNSDPTWLGHSIGRWEGDEFVVDTIGFNDRGWTGLSHPRSEQFRTIERYRRDDYGNMELEFTIIDPEIYEAPWVQRMPLYLAPDEELMEYVCENERWLGSIDD